MYFLQKDDIMLHFTLSGSSDITGYQCLLPCLLSCKICMYVVEIEITIVKKWQKLVSQNKCMVSKAELFKKLYNSYFRLWQIEANIWSSSRTNDHHWPSKLFYINCNSKC